MHSRIVKYFPRFFLFVGAVLLAAYSAEAQCAMCKAVAEDAASRGEYGIWAGLNLGIMFLMAFPYICLAIVVLVFFRKRVKGFIKAFNSIHK